MAKIVERVGGRRVRVHEIPGDEWTLGALATADAPLTDPTLGGCTLRFVRWVSGWRVEDVGGEARTVTIDGEEATGSDPLPDRSLLRLGSTELEFDASEPEERWDEPEPEPERRPSRATKSAEREARVQALRAPPPAPVPIRTVPAREAPRPDPFGGDTPRRTREPQSSGGGGALRRVFGILFWVLLILGFQFGRRFLQGDYGDSDGWFSGDDPYEEVQLTPLEVDLQQLEADLETLESFPQTRRQDWLLLQGRVEEVARSHPMDESSVARLQTILERIDRALLGGDSR